MSDRNVLQPTFRGHYFEEFEVGQEIVSAGRTVTEADVMAFAALSGDYNPLHTDEVFARSSPFGQRVAHGLLGLAIATGLVSLLGFVEGTALAFRGLEWKFTQPILFDDTIYVQVRVVHMKPMPRLGGGLVVFEAALVNQRSEVTQKGTWQMLVKSRDDKVTTP
jgi:3-hydroxybutyryl-CoA dehydratase